MIKLLQVATWEVATIIILFIVLSQFHVYISLITRYGSITWYGSTLYMGIAMVFCILPIH